MNTVTKKSQGRLKAQGEKRGTEQIYFVATSTNIKVDKTDPAHSLSLAGGCWGGLGGWWSWLSPSHCDDSRRSHPWSVIRTRRSRITHMRTTRKHGICRARNAQTKRAKVQKIAALFQGSTLLYIVEYCWAVWRSSSINLGVIRRTRLWHGQAHPEQGRAQCGGKLCMGLLWNRLLCIMSGARRVLLGRHGQVPGHTRVSGDSGPLCVEAVQQHLPHHHAIAAMTSADCKDFSAAWMKSQPVYGGSVSPVQSTEYWASASPPTHMLSLSFFSTMFACSVFTLKCFGDFHLSACFVLFSFLYRYVIPRAENFKCFTWSKSLDAWSTPKKT